MSETRETRLLMISPDSMVMPDVLVRTVHTMADDVSVKETCYGCLVESDAATMKGIIAQVRKDYGNEVFTKRRGFPAGDPRRCRAQHGTRPGFAQMEAEWECLSLIQHALDAGDTGYKPAAERKHISITELKKICEEYQ